MRVIIGKPGLLKFIKRIVILQAVASKPPGRGIKRVARRRRRLAKGLLVRIVGGAVRRRAKAALGTGLGRRMAFKLARF